MLYCTNCGRQVTDEARFCAACGCAVNAPTEAEQAPTAEVSAAGLNDVPWWIGWLVPAVSLLTLGFGLILYPIWTYRRGRRDGVGREPTEEPYKDMGWPTVGWALAHVVPILSWYAGIHLPTMWYKHGLRVGARDGAAPRRFTSLPALVATLPFLGVLGILMITGLAAASQPPEERPPYRFNLKDLPLGPLPTIRPLATPSGPRLTGAEAAGKAEASLRTYVREQGQQSGNDFSQLVIYCDPEDFNDFTETWILFCTLEGPAKSLTFRYRVDDKTGVVSPVN